MRYGGFAKTRLCPRSRARKGQAVEAGHGTRSWDTSGWACGKGGGQHAVILEWLLSGIRGTLSGRIWADPDLAGRFLAGMKRPSICALPFAAWGRWFPCYAGRIGMGSPLRQARFKTEIYSSPPSRRSVRPKLGRTIVRACKFPFPQSSPFFIAVHRRWSLSPNRISRLPIRPTEQVASR